MVDPTASRAAAPVGFTGRAAVVMRRSVTAVVFVIAGLTFCFGFGNGYAVGVQLGVPGWIAPLVAPAIDLSVVALLASMQYLRTNGYGGRLLGPRLLLLFSGAATLAMNTAHPVITGAYGQACFYAVAPLLLIGWSEVGPRLLASMHGTSPGPSPGDRIVGRSVHMRSQDQLVRVPSKSVASHVHVIEREAAARRGAIEGLFGGGDIAATPNKTTSTRARKAGAEG